MYKEIKVSHELTKHSASNSGSWSLLISRVIFEKVFFDSICIEFCRITCSR